MSKRDVYKVPTPPSPGEAAFALHCGVEGIEFVREYRFHPTRKWRFDFAFPELKIAVEIEGAVFGHGRHSRGVGMEADMEKYNAAVIEGWKVLRFSTDMVLGGIAIRDLKKLIGAVS